jgi:hypothetical protein
MTNFLILSDGTVAAQLYKVQVAAVLQCVYNNAVHSWPVSAAQAAKRIRQHRCKRFLLQPAQPDHWQSSAALGRRLADGSRLICLPSHPVAPELQQQAALWHRL